MVGGLSSSSLIGSYGMRRIGEPRTVRFALEGLEVLGPSARYGCLVCEGLLAIRAAQWALDLVSGVIYCFQGFIESSVVTRVSTQMTFRCQVVPPLVLNLSELALENTASSPEGCFLFRAGWLCKTGMMC